MSSRSAQVNSASIAVFPLRATIASLAIAGLVAATIGILATPAHAAVVMTDDDFRDEIAAALCDGNEDVIEIGSSFSFTNFTAPVWNCSDDLTIRSTAGNHFTIDGSDMPNTRFLNATGATGTITIIDLTITGFEHTGTSAYASFFGGAIRSSGPVVIEGSTFSNNYAVSTGTGAANQGGAIYTTSTVTVRASAQSDSYFTDNYVGGSFANESWNSGGAIFASGGVDVSDAHFTGNSASGSGNFAGAEGGAIFSSGGPTITDSTFTNNAANGNFIGGGGAVSTNGLATIENVTFTSNEVTGVRDNWGGALRSFGDVDIVDSVFTNNTVTSATLEPSGGGAVSAWNGTVSGSTFTDNSASGTSHSDVRGGAARFGGDAVITHSTFSGNSLASADEGNALGGAVYIGEESEIAFSTFDGNSATATLSGTAAHGGAIFGDDSATLFANTFTGNSVSAVVPSDAFGGALAVHALTSISNTLVSNSAGVGAQVSTSTLNSYGTVYALGTGGNNCLVHFPAITRGFNFDDDASCFATAGDDFGHGVDPLLGALADNGGPTRTRMPQTGSPLIDAITDGECVGGHGDDAGFADTDQRGVDRPALGCDVGAVEVLATVLFSVVTPGGTVNGTVYNGLSVSGEAHVDPATLGTPPAGVLMPLGALDFTIQVPQPGWSVTVVLELPSPVSQFWKYQSGAWSQVPGADISGTTITYQLTDGGAGDDDGIANSEIVDPAAPGIGVLFAG